MFRFADVDPRTLHLPTTRFDGAVPAKFTRQLEKYGKSVVGMPPIEVNEDADGRLVIVDGVTRATRVARLLPGQTVRVKIMDSEPRSVAAYPTVGDRLP